MFLTQNEGARNSAELGQGLPALGGATLPFIPAACGSETSDKTSAKVVWDGARLGITIQWGQT